jgi:hypothetical protein
MADVSKTDRKPRISLFRRILRAFTGRWARRIYVAILILLLLLTAAGRLRSYIMALKIDAVLRGFAEMKLDQTTEEQLIKTVPYLAQKDRTDRGGVLHRWFTVHISNESDLWFSWLIKLRVEWLGYLADWLGYRFISFDAAVLVQDGKVTHVEYGLANQWVRPQYAGYTGYIVSARSVHGYWIDRRVPFLVSSQDDESPHYRPTGNANGIYVTYSADAPSKSVQHLFHLNLRCFWGWKGCVDAREIAPSLWQDIQSIQHETYQQLISGTCPDSIVEGRMRYLPDITVSLLEVTGSRRIEVNEEGDRAEDWFTDYTLKEAIRGKSNGPWKNIRFRRTISALDDHTRIMANQIWPETRIGTLVLFFDTPKFHSCRFIPATPSNLEIVRRMPIAQKRPEDEIPWGLQ